jgi:anti-anti-sigma regulatory factor
MERLEEVGGKIIFTHLDPAVEKTFTIMGLFQFAEKAGNDDDAVKQFA